MDSVGCKPEAIVFIGAPVDNVVCSWQEFCELANHEYNNDYGWQQVASDLEIHFVNGARMTRTEYDGSERWEFHRPLWDGEGRRPEQTPVCSLFQTKSAVTLREIQEQECILIR